MSINMSPLSVVYYITIFMDEIIFILMTFGMCWSGVISSNYPPTHVECHQNEYHFAHENGDIIDHVEGAHINRHSDKLQI